MTAWEINTRLVAHSIATYAISFDDFPKRQSVKSSDAKAIETIYKYRGSKLVI